jgi:hypothetical protein
MVLMPVSAPIKSFEPLRCRPPEPGTNMNRREFITLLGAALTWPLTTRAQQGRMRRLGVLMGFSENDPEGTLWLSSFTQAFQELGWVDGRSVQIDVRWSASNVERERKMLFVALHESVHGTNRQLEGGQSMSALPRYFRHQLVPLLPARHRLRCPGI